MTTKNSSMMIVLSSPSGAGKTTITKMIAQNKLDFVISTSYTTRKPRLQETKGKDYHFISEDEFKKLISEDFFLEHAFVFEHLYGTPKNIVFEKLSEGKNVLFDIDWQGTQQLKKKIVKQKLITIFILPPDIKTLKSRIINREKNGEKLAQKRMKNFSQEVSHWREYDYVVINRELNKCYNDVCSIINSEKLGNKMEFNTSEINKVVKNLTS